MPRHSCAAFALPIPGANTFYPSPEKKEKRWAGGQKKRKERRRVELRDRCDFVACGLSLRLPVRPRASSLRAWGPVSLSVCRSRTSGALLRVVGNYEQGVRTGRMDDLGLGFGELWMIFQKKFGWVVWAFRISIVERVVVC